jgi:hypothetical protein
VLLARFLNFVISMIIRGERFRYKHLLKMGYYILSVLNVIFIALVLGIFSDANFNLDLPLIASQ